MDSERKNIKSFIKLKKINNSSYYNVVNKKLLGDDFTLLNLAAVLIEFHLESLILFLLNHNMNSYQENENLIIKKKNKFEFYSDGNLNNDNSSNDMIIDIENLKELAQDWKRLYEKDAPVIYLIVRDDGWVVVREELDGL